jgi:hypothetical protein
MDGRCQLWDPDSGKQTGGFVLAKGYPLAVVFGGDDKRLLACNSEGTARLWDTDTGLPLGPELPCKGQGTPHAAFDQQSTRFLLQDDDGTRLYLTPAPVQGEVERVVLWVHVLTGLELDAEGRMQVLSSEQWDDRRRRLGRLGGPLR